MSKVYCPKRTMPQMENRTKMRLAIIERKKTAVVGAFPVIEVGGVCKIVSGEDAMIEMAGCLNMRIENNFYNGK